MRKYFILLTLLGFSLSAYGLDSLFTTISGDTLTIHHEQTFRNCGVAFVYRVEQSDNLITVTEVDTGAAAFCMCYFDLSVSLVDLQPGSYQIDVWGNDQYSDPVFYGSLDLIWGGLASVGQSESDCLASRDDTSFIDLSVYGDTLTLFWNTPMLNCIFMPVWTGWLVADTFHVTMVDTGPPVDCICPFEVEASFASFAPGSYVLDFWEGEYGYPGFSIGSIRENPVLVDNYQSACYDLTARPDTYPKQSPMKPTAIGLIQCYPNPFNAEVMISFEVWDNVELHIQVFSVEGRLISPLGPPRSFTPGTYTLNWDAKDAEGRPLSSGIYLLVIRSPQGLRVSRLVFLG